MMGRVGMLKKGTPLLSPHAAVESEQDCESYRGAFKRPIMGFAGVLTHFSGSETPNLVLSFVKSINTVCSVESD